MFCHFVDPACAETIAAANSLTELRSQLGACFVSKAQWRSSGEITVNFSLRRDGSLIGRPHVSFLKGDAAARQQVMDQAAAALDRCLPAKISDGLGGAIAGRPIRWLFMVHGKENGI
jgi:hypothetical protein